MTAYALFTYIFMAGLALACLFLVGLACWLAFLTVKGWVVTEPMPQEQRDAQRRQAKERRRRFLSRAWRIATFRWAS